MLVGMRYLLLALLVPSVCLAENVFLWDAPTSREDGSPLDGKDILRYRYYRDGVLKANVNAPSVSEAPPTTYKDTTLLTLGEHTFYVTAVDRQNRESGQSNVVSIVILPPPTVTPKPTATVITKPNPPTALRQ